MRLMDEWIGGDHPVGVFNYSPMFQGWVRVPEPCKSRRGPETCAGSVVPWGLTFNSPRKRNVEMLG
jgi:hypothetical protein